METRKLGRSDISVPPLILGGNVFGWTADKEESFYILDAALDAGLNAIDTADVYSIWVPGNSGGDSETVIGEWMKARNNRDKVVIFTKLGFEMGPDQKGLSKKWMGQAIENSLTRLQTDYIDLYQSHTDDQEVPLEETLGAFGELISQGKVRAIGASNYSGSRLKEALDVSAKLGVPRYESIQPKYNLMEREVYESELEPVVLAEEVGVVNYYALAAGFLTGKYRSEEDLGKSPRGGGAKQYLDERGFRVLATLDQIAAKHNATQAEVALAWLLARPSVTSPIVSASKVGQVEGFAKAIDLRLGAEDVEALSVASQV